MIFCTTCNIPFEADSQFCSSCGGFVDYVGVQEGADAPAKRLPLAGAGTGDQSGEPAADDAAGAGDAAAVADQAAVEAQAQEDDEQRARAAGEAEQRALADARAQEQEEEKARARAAAAAAAETKARAEADAETDITEKAEAEAEARSQAAAKAKAETEAAAAAKAAEASRRAAAMVAKVAAPPRKAPAPPPPEPTPEPPAPERPTPEAPAPRPPFTPAPAPWSEATLAYDAACPKCGGGNPPGRAFCRQCGARLEYAAPAVVEPPTSSEPSPRPGPASKTPPLVPLVAVGLAVVVILAVAVVLLTRGASDGGGSNEVVVAADAGWVDTGITLAPGEQAILTASGSVVADVNEDPEESFDPDGSPQTGESPGDPVQDANHAALVGRLDSEEFFVGSGPFVLEGPTSELFLRVNDAPVDDNEGEFTVTIEVSEVDAG